MQLEQEIKNAIRTVPDFPKAGIQFKDITPLFYKPALCRSMVEGLMESMTVKPDAVAGIESRGFLLGLMLANELGVPFVMVRKAGKLPGKTLRKEYQLEYGSAVIEIQADAVQKDWNVLIHDDLLATGGTAAAAAELIESAGARVSEFNFVVGLDFLNGRDKLVNHTNNITCLVHF